MKPHALEPIATANRINNKQITAEAAGGDTDRYSMLLNVCYGFDGAHWHLIVVFHVSSKQDVENFFTASGDYWSV